MSDKGIELIFVAPTIVDGSVTAKSDKNEVEKMNEKWENVIIMYVVGQNPTITPMNAYIKAHWGLLNAPTLFKHDEGYFVIQMICREYRASTLYFGPHLFYGKPMIVKQWTSKFYFHKEILKVVPIWVKLPNLPPNCWSDNSLSRIGSVLCVPNYADECTTKF